DGQCAQGGVRTMRATTTTSGRTGYWRYAAAAVLALGLMPIPAHAASFMTFESGQVRPLALSPDGTRLYAVNTPDDRLALLHVTSRGLVHHRAVHLGLA